MRTLKEVWLDIGRLERFFDLNEKNARCKGPCPGVQAYFDGLVSELMELREPCLVP